MPEVLATLLAEFASSLRNVGAIRSDAIEHAFASVARHRCVPQFRYSPKTITVPHKDTKTHRMRVINSITTRSPSSAITRARGGTGPDR